MNYFQNYDSRKLFESADFGYVKRKLGVLVSLPFDHMGRPDHPRCVEVSYETPTVNTATYAQLAVLEHHWRPEAIAQTDIVIRDCDKLIADLNRHRSRLIIAVKGLREFERMKHRIIAEAVEANL